MARSQRWPLQIALVLVLASFSACSHHRVSPEGNPFLRLSGENHLTNVRQLTFGGISVKTSWSFDGHWLTYQHRNFGDAPPSCDQINRVSADGKVNQPVSSGLGRASSPHLFQNDSRILYSSTFDSSAACPEFPALPHSHSHPLSWPLFQTTKLYSSKTDGTDTIPLEPAEPRAYTSQATVCKDGSVVFTSDRDGDPDLYTAKLDPMGTIHDIRRITHILGYDGEAAFSPDCKEIVWSASRPRTHYAIRVYRQLLHKHIINPGELEIWVAHADGTSAHPVTRLKAESLAPSFTPDGRRIIFASNYRGLQDPGRAGEKTFSLYLIDSDGTHLERITSLTTSESFPVFSPNGKYLAFSSTRNAKRPFETNVFIADWVDWVEQPRGAKVSRPTFH